MSEIIERRRVLIDQSQGKDASILWQIENRTINGGSIETDVKLFESDIDWSIAYDITISSFANASAPLFAVAFNATGSNYSLYFLRNGGIPTINYMGGTAIVSRTAIGTGRFRFILSHVHGTTECNCIYKVGNQTQIIASVSRNFSASHRLLQLGTKTGNNQLPQGTLNSVVVRNRILSQKEINAFFAD